MQSKNVFTIRGFVGENPELRKTESGKSYAFISVATNYSSVDKTTGDSKDVAQWHSIKVWGKLAENACNIVKKASLIEAEGSINPSKFINKDGETVFSTDLVAMKIDVLIRAKEAEETPAPQKRNKSNK